MTSNQKSWGPQERNIQPCRVMDTVVECAKEESVRKKAPISCTLYEARSQKARVLNGKEIVQHRSKLGQDCRLRSVLPSQLDDVFYVDTIYGKAPLGSVLSVQCCNSLESLEMQVVESRERQARRAHAAEKQC